MIHFKILARCWKKALLLRARPLRHLLTAGRCTEVGCRTSDIMNISFEVRILCDQFCLFNDRFMTSRLNNSPLMEGEGAETASSETAPVADQ